MLDCNFERGTFRRAFISPLSLNSTSSHSRRHPHLASSRSLWPRQVLCILVAAGGRSLSCWRSKRSWWAWARAFWLDWRGCVCRAPGTIAKGLAFLPERFTCRRGRALPVKDGNMSFLKPVLGDTIIRAGISWWKKYLTWVDFGEHKSFQTLVRLLVRPKFYDEPIITYITVINLKHIFETYIIDTTTHYKNTYLAWNSLWFPKVFIIWFRAN